MKVGELKAELNKYPDEATVFYDMLDTPFFQDLMKIFGSTMPYPDGSVRGVEVNGLDGPMCDCIVWLKENAG
jgi:hypothetical protein